MIPDKDTDYFPQLDALRAIAVFFVLLEHWVPGTYWFKIFPYGMAGVTLFFVLSGFLISRILLRSRIKSESLNQSKLHSLKQFYIRRTLRIFPIYYITIFILLIFNINNIRQIFFWFLTYTSNIYFYLIQNWAGSLSHLWTLAVEEQFYIIWPFIILFIPKRFLFRTIILIISTGPVFRTVLFLFSNGSPAASDFIHILTPSCMDSFGLGALLAYAITFNFKIIDLMKIRQNKICIGSFILIIIFLLTEVNSLSVFLFRTCISVLSLFIILKALTGFKGTLRYILDNKFFIYLGKISYGLYLFHNFIPSVWNLLKLSVPENMFLKFISYSLLLIAISSVSWYLIEKPANGLKKHFSYN